MAKYSYMFTHKVSQTCKCGQPQGSHSRLVTLDPYVRTYGEGPCEHSGCAGFEQRIDGVIEVAEAGLLALVAAGDFPMLAAWLKSERLLLPGTKVLGTKLTESKLVVFPGNPPGMTTGAHAITFVKLAPTDVIAEVRVPGARKPVRAYPFTTQDQASAWLANQREIYSRANQTGLTFTSAPVGQE
jgi:hypothetical protein